MAVDFVLHLDVAIMEGQMAPQVLHHSNRLLLEQEALVALFGLLLALVSKLHDGDQTLGSQVGHQVVLDFEQLEESLG